MRIIRNFLRLLRHRRRDALRFLHPDSRVCARSELQFPLYVAKDAVIKRSRLAACSYVARGSQLIDVSVGRYSSLGPECLIGGLGRHPTAYFSTSPLTYSTKNAVSVAIGGAAHDIGYEETGPVTIAEDVWIGARCIIVDGVTIGRGSIIGANTVITKNIPPYSVVYGSPPQLRPRFAPEIVARLEASLWWQKTPAEIDHVEMARIVEWPGPASQNPATD